MKSFYAFDQLIVLFCSLWLKHRELTPVNLVSISTKDLLNEINDHLHLIAEVVGILEALDCLYGRTAGESFYPTKIDYCEITSGYLLPVLNPVPGIDISPTLHPR